MKPITTRHVIVTRPANGQQYPVMRMDLNKQKVHVTMSKQDAPLPPMKMVAPGHIGQDQLLALLAAWGSPDDDGVVDINDLVFDIINHWDAVIETPPELGESTNCELGPYGGYNVLTGTERFIVGKAVSGVVRGLSMENDQTVDMLRIEDFASSSSNYGGYGSPKTLKVRDWVITTKGGGDDYGYRGVVKTLDIDGWDIIQQVANKSSLRLTGVTGGSAKRVTIDGNIILLGGGSSDGSNHLGFNNATLEVKHTFHQPATADPKWPVSLCLYAGHGSTIMVNSTLPQGIRLATVWAAASCKMGGTVNGTKLTEQNKSQFVDGAPGASNVTIVT